MTFQDLSTKKKIEHIWIYYRVHMGLTLLVVVILVSWIYNAKFKLHKDLYSGVAILSYHLPDDYTDTLYDKINSRLGLTDTNSEVTINYFYDDESEVDFMASMLEKFAAMLLTGDVNIMIMDKDSMAEYAAEDYLLDLSTVYSEEELKQMEEEGLLLSSESELVPEGKYYAICLKNSALMAELPNYDEEENYIGIFGAVEDAEKPKDVVDILISAQKTELLPAVQADS
ncbi:MAG: hypothetical protein LUD77_07305 [Clostridiales bacterium]|nr:hypothetical protein [Clostridiales bacterium]